MAYQSEKSIPTNNLKEMITKFRSLFAYLKSKWMILFLSAIISSVLGFFYASIQPIKYISKLTFVVVENKGGAGGLSSLAGQFGFDIGSGSGGGGVFTADNILLFLKSKSLIRETLLTSYTERGSKTLADQFAIVRGKKKQWQKNSKIGEIDFYKIGRAHV